MSKYICRFWINWNQYILKSIKTELTKHTPAKTTGSLEEQGGQQKEAGLEKAKVKIWFSSSFIKLSWLEVFLPENCQSWILWFMIFCASFLGSRPWKQALHKKFSISYFASLILSLSSFETFLNHAEILELLVDRHKLFCLSTIYHFR